MLGGSTLFKPSTALNAPDHAHESWHLQLNLQVDEWRLERGFVNGSSFRPNLGFPTLHRLLDGSTTVDQETLGPAHGLVLSTAGISVVDIILQNLDPGNHPFHLHGHFLWVLASGPGTFPGYAPLGFRPDGKGLFDPRGSNMLENSPSRDVVTVEGGGWLLVRFVADNPGLWLFHCHMVWHSEAGMAMQFLSRPEVLRELHLPEGNAALCRPALADLEKGATPKDSIWTSRQS
jgi:hypothetical protein